MDILTEIKVPIQEEIKNFDQSFREALQCDNELINRAVDHFIQKKGKNLRPILVLLAAKCATGKVNKKTFDTAIALELFHNATLLHDDVLDETNMRRGLETINSKFNSKLAVLLGDYFLSIALQKAVTTDNIYIVKSLSEFAATSVDGEIQQMFTAQSAAFSEENYYKIIYKKTASLFETCFRVGALSVDSSEERIDKLEKFAYYLGLIFQIRDDIFDYFKSDEVGKPTGNDIREGKVTLPLIYALSHSENGAGDRMLQLIKEKDFTPENIQLLIDFAIENQGIEYAEKKMEEFKLKALDCLESFSNTAEKESLITVLNYTIQRNK